MKVMRSFRWQIFVAFVAVLLAAFAVQLGAQKGVTVLGAEPVNEIRSLFANAQSLQTQIRDLQTKLSGAVRGGGANAGNAGTLPGGKVMWSEPVNEMRGIVASMQNPTKKLQSYYRSINNPYGIKFSTDLGKSLSSLAATLDKLGQMSGASQAQVSVNGINTSIAKVRLLVNKISLTSPQGITQDEAERNHQSGVCAGEGLKHIPPATCKSRCTQTSSGSGPNDGPTFSCTCIC